MFPEQAFGRGYVLFGGKVVFWGQNGLIAGEVIKDIAGVNAK